MSVRLQDLDKGTKVYFVRGSGVILQKHPEAAVLHMDTEVPDGPTLPPQAFGLKSGVVVMYDITTPIVALNYGPATYTYVYETKEIVRGHILFVNGDLGVVSSSEGDEFIFLPFSEQPPTACTNNYDDSPTFQILKKDKSYPVFTVALK